MMTFENWNNEINYYSSISKKTGKNSWNQNSAQLGFIELIENCELTKEQAQMLEESMIKNNAVLDMEPSNNKESIEKFHSVIKIKELDGKSKTI